MPRNADPVPVMTDHLVAYLQMITTGLKDPMQALRIIRTAREELRSYETQVARAAHDAGASWTDIGQTLGISKQAARRRYGPLETDMEQPERSVPNDA